MKQQPNHSVLPWVLLAAPVLWMGAVLAYAYEDGMNLFELLGRFAVAMDHPFAIGWTPYTLKFMLGTLVVYGFAVTMYLSSKQNRRPGEEHGSAHWGNVYQLDRKYRDKNIHNNVILSQHIHMTGKASSATRTASFTWAGTSNPPISTFPSCWGRKPSKPAPAAKARGETAPTAKIFNRRAASF